MVTSFNHVVRAIIIGLKNFLKKFEYEDAHNGRLRIDENAYERGGTFNPRAKPKKIQIYTD